MRLCVDYGTDVPLHLVSAILLYGSKDALYGNHKIRLATVHTPEPNPAGGPPVLGEGQPVSKSFVETLSRSLQSELPAAWLPENVLIWSQRLAAWWEPARIRAMFFSPESDGKTLDGKLYPHPALLFAVREGHLSVWALAGKTRPTPNTQLFQAPYWNTYENGEICHGSMQTPRLVDLDNLRQWSDGYFNSRFTHTNLQRSLCHHPEGFLGMWRDLAGRKRFPVEYLLPKRSLRETLCQHHPYTG
jgi:PRTRC genetic system protein B